MPEYKIEFEMSAQDYSHLIEGLEGTLKYEQKWCGGCRNWRQRSAFHVQSPEDSADLMSSQCKYCRNNRNRSRGRERARLK